MKQLTIEDIRKLDPCYDPTKYISEDWTGTVVDLLQITDCPANDRIWVSLRLMPRFLVEVFAIDCSFDAATYATRAAATDNAATAYAATAAYATAAYAADYAAAYATATAAYAADDAAYAADDARKLTRQQQITTLIYLLEGDA